MMFAWASNLCCCSSILCLSPSTSVCDCVCSVSMALTLVSACLRELLLSNSLRYSSSLAGERTSSSVLGFPA